LVALLLSFVFLPAFERGIFSVFYIAVVISAWRGGFGPAVLSMGIGAAAHILFLESPYYNSPVTAQDWLRVAIFILVSLAIALIANQLEKNKRDLARALDAERASQARIRALTDSVDEALVLISPERRVLDINRRFVELFETPAENIVGQTTETLERLLEQIFGVPKFLDESAPTQDNARRFVAQQWPRERELEFHVTPVRSAAGGDDAGMLGDLYVFRDVTHARQVDRMKTEFVSLVSHELRTPLTSIKGYTEMVLDGDAGEINDEVQDYLGVVFKNAERLVALVNDLLDISRMESGRIQIKSEPVDLNEIAQLVVATMQQKIQEKEQTLAVNVDASATQVMGDRDKLIQVLTNYVSNAHKYTQAGGAIRIEITKQNEFAHVAVIDNGYGISQADQEKLFTRFYRVDNSMTREIGGTGLGLAIVKQLIELQGGAVGVTSELGKGSTFYFTIPLAMQTTEPVSPQVVEREPHVRAGATILVIEDDADVARLLQHHLQKAGYVVRVAHSAEEAQADIDLPDLRGDELALALKSDPLTRDIPTLALTIFADDPARVQFAAYSLPKPVAQDELLDTVSKMLHTAPHGPVLIIDDDADVRRLLQTALEKNGLRAETAADGTSGLARANARHPALILLDMRLPDMDGFAVLRALQESPETADIPVIAMTGSPDLKTAARARVLALGASDFVTKPFDMEKLVQEIRIFTQ
jgi:signal transduction histidine kinase/CheY-like chemotaxis protein